MEFINTNEKEAHKVDILIITRNHQAYIEKAIESALAQKCDFKYRLIIGDDASTDGTSKYLTEVASLFPGIIELKIHGSCIGVFENFKDTFYRCNADYIAILEGDDYWIDPRKLQKQVDFLDKHLDVSLSSHFARIEKNKMLVLEKYTKITTGFKTTNDIIKTNFIPAASAVFRRSMLSVLPEWFPKNGLVDWPLWTLLSTKGKIHLTGEEMSVYRIHPNGFWSSKNKLEHENIISEAFLVIASNNKTLKNQITTILQMKRFENIINVKSISRYIQIKSLIKFFINDPKVFLYMSLLNLRKKIGLKTRLRRIKRKCKHYYELLSSKFGSKFCPVCKQKVRRFYPFSVTGSNLLKNLIAHGFSTEKIEQMECLNLKEYSCPLCTATDRERLIAWYLQEAKDYCQNKRPELKILEIGPGGVITNFLSNLPNAELDTFDIEPGKSTICGDIQDMKDISSGFYDLIVCSHVLEHIPDDRKAMSEIARVLNGSGQVIFLVPIDKSANQTIEDKNCMDERIRIKLFGQRDHLRMYSSREFINRLETSGFCVKKEKVCSTILTKEMGIQEEAVLYIARKN